jgi:ribosome-associated protein
MTKKITAAQIKNMITAVLKEHQAIELSVFNIKPLTDIADYMIICTANSTVHAKTLIEKVRNELGQVPIKPIGTEGDDARQWMLIDFGEVITHVMLDPIRKFYKLEKLWDIKPAKSPRPQKKQGKKN